MWDQPRRDKRMKGATASDVINLIKYQLHKRRQSLAEFFWGRYDYDVRLEEILASIEIVEDVEQLLKGQEVKVEMEIFEQQEQTECAVAGMYEPRGKEHGRIIQP